MAWIKDPTRTPPYDQDEGRSDLLLDASARVGSLERRLEASIEACDQVHTHLHNVLRIASEEVERVEPIPCPSCDSHFIDGRQLDADPDDRLVPEVLDRLGWHGDPMFFVGLLEREADSTGPFEPTDLDRATDGES